MGAPSIKEMAWIFGLALVAVWVSNNVDAVNAITARKAA